jgi:hypothetical protein
MSKWPMQGHFGRLHFKAFPMTSRMLKCKEIWPLQSSSEFSGVPEDSNFPLLGVWASPSHLAQSGVATNAILRKHFNLVARGTFQHIYFFLEIVYFGSQKDRKYMLGNLPRSGLVRIKYNFAYQITLCFWPLWISLTQTMCLLMWTS